MKASLFKELAGLRRESVCCTPHTSTLWSSPEWPWKFLVGWHKAKRGLLSAKVCLMHLQVHWLIGFCRRISPRQSILTLALASLFMHPIYTLYIVYKIYRLKRTILSSKVDLIFLKIYSIMEMLLHYQTLLKGWKADFYLIPVFPVIWDRVVNKP